jgi:hypothetical protein
MGQAPLPRAGTQRRPLDEYLILKGEQYVPYNPPKYVPEGMSPVAAGWDMTRKTGIQHHTRRVEQ